MKLFGKKKPEALVFVDFEYMQISFKKRYGIQPPVQAWYHTLEEQYQIADTYVFADFSSPQMKYNLPRLREITNNIIETQNTGSHHKKDFTDFFLLDRIYQKAFEKHRASVFILFTGDGHFGAVSRFLITRCHKKVVIYGIEGTISSQLRSMASEVVEYPDMGTLRRQYYPLIARQAQRMAQEKKGGSLSRQALEHAMTEQQALYQPAVTEAMDEMIEAGYLFYKEQWVSSIKRIRVLAFDTEKLKNDGIL